MGTALVYVLVMCIVAIVVGALIVQLATKLVAGFKPGFGVAVGVVIVGMIAGAVASWVLGMVMGAGTGSTLAALVVAFLVNAAVLNALIKHPSGGALGFGKACLVTLVQYIIEIVLAVILAFLFGSVIFRMILMHWSEYASKPALTAMRGSRHAAASAMNTREAPKGASFVSANSPQ